MTSAQWKDCDWLGLRDTVIVGQRNMMQLTTVPLRRDSGSALIFEEIFGTAIKCIYLLLTLLYCNIDIIICVY